MKAQEKEILVKLEKARELYRAQKFEPAIEIFTEIAALLKDDPENLPIIQIELGWSFFHAQRYREAVAVLQDAVKNEHLTTQQKFDCQRITGYCYQLTNDYQNAQLFLEKAIGLDVPPQVKRFAYFELGKVLFSAGNILAAEKNLQEAEKLFSDSETEYSKAIAYYRGFSEYLQNRFDTARQYFDRLIDANQDAQTQASGYFGLAHLHFHSKDYVVVVDLCEKILRLDPGFFDKETLGYFLCTAYLEQKKWTSLEPVFAEMEKNYPDGRYANEYSKFRMALDARR